MRILVATRHQSVVGGVETYLRELLPALQERGHDVALLVEHPATADHEAVDRASQCPVWQAGASDWTELLRQLSSWCPDIVCVQGLGSPDLEEALQQAFPTVLCAHDYYGTCLTGLKRHAWPHACPCDRVRGLGCLLQYYPRRCGGMNPMTLWRQHRLQGRREKLLRGYRAVLVASRHMQREYLRHGVPPARLHLTPLFPPGDVPDAASPVERPATGRVLFLGRLTEVKGVAYLAPALAQASDQLRRPLSLIVAGDGPEAGRLRALANSFGITAEFHGWVGPDQRRTLMRGADVLAVPSVWPEPFGLVGLEAACVGLPAVAFAVGGIPDWLQPGQSGELAPADPPRVQGLAQALVRALSDPAHLSELRCGAWRQAAAFTRDNHVRHLEAILTQVAAAAYVGVGSA